MNRVVVGSHVKLWARVMLKARVRTLMTTWSAGPGSRNMQGSAVVIRSRRKPETDMETRRAVKVRRGQPQCCAAHQFDLTMRKWNGITPLTFHVDVGAPSVTKPP